MTTRCRSARVPAFVSAELVALALACSNGSSTPTARATAPAIVVADSIAPAGDRRLPFGNVDPRAGHTGTVTVANAGSAPLVVGTVASASPLVPPFSLGGDTCSGRTLDPESTCTLTVRFAPDTAGVFAGSFDVPSSDPAERSTTISVSGSVQPVISVAPRPLVLDDTAVGVSGAGIVTVSNVGTAPLSLGSVAEANPLAAPFSVAADACSGSTLPPGGSCTIQVRFVPTARGAFADVFDIPSDDPASTSTTCAVSARGGARVISVADSQVPIEDHLIDFGFVTSGSVSKATVTVTNAGDLPLALGPIAAARPLSAPFSAASDGCSHVTLARGARCTVEVRFAPSASGAFAGAFDVPSDDPATPSVTVAVAGHGAVAPPWPAPVAATGQTTCWDPAHATTACAGTGQDGELRSGVPWPSPRFTRGPGAADACITDGLTGLVWSRDGNLPAGTVTWQEALDWVAALDAGAGLCGYHDWRLPNRNELRSVVSYGEADVSAWLDGAAQGFVNVEASGYWSSTTGTLASDHAAAWAVDMVDGRLFLHDKAGAAGGLHVWPVRAGSTLAPAPIARTGQTVCYTTAGASIPCAGTGQDGAVQAGVVWPGKRFTVNADTSVTDNLTGLIWAPDADPRIFSPCPALGGGSEAWQAELLWIRCIDGNGALRPYLGHSDWRLPTVNELQTLENAGDSEGTWLAAQGFTGAYGLSIRTVSEWTSDTQVAAPGNAWEVSHGRGMTPTVKSTMDLDAWPVRGP